MSFPTTSALAGLAWYLASQSSHSDRLSFIASIVKSLPISQSALVSIAKWAFGITSVHYLSSQLTELARNNWRLADTGRWNWKNEIAVVTGGCSGIGEEIARALAKRGVKVVILDVSPLPERLESVIAHYIKCDVTDSDAVDAAAVEIREKLGSPSILINNAGIGSDYPIFDLPPQRVKKLVEVNLTSHWFTCRAFGPDRVKRNKGHIIEIASMSSFLGVGVFSDYSACKLALVSFTESLREQLRGWYAAPDVHVTIVHPLFVETNMTRYQKEAIEKSTGKMLSAPAVGAEIAGQIFKCKGAQMVIPGSFSFLRSIRGWPGWMMTLVKDMMKPMPPPQVHQ